jgi:hypothetical protein
MSTAPAIAATAATRPESSNLHYTRKLGRICPECGGKVEVPEKGPGQHKKFCSPTCKSKFAAREKAQGAVLITIAKVYHMTRHGKTREDRETRGLAMAEMGRILRAFVAEDKAAGRADRLAPYMLTLVNLDDSYQERRRRS